MALMTVKLLVPVGSFEGHHTSPQCRVVRSGVMHEVLIVSLSLQQQRWISFDSGAGYSARMG